MRLGNANLPSYRVVTALYRLVPDRVKRILFEKLAEGAWHSGPQRVNCNDIQEYFEGRG